MTSSTSTAQAIIEMRQRGIDDAESLVSSTSPDRIIQTCQWWDGLSGVTKGLLVKKIREGGVDVEPAPSSKRARLRERFDEFASNYSVGDIPESHAKLQARQHPEDDRCAGMMVIVDQPTWPFVNVQCDLCGFQAAYPARSLSILPASPPTNPRPVPVMSTMVPEHQHRGEH